MAKFKAPFYTQSQIDAMDEKDIEFPFSDKWMKYDEDKQQYLPTFELLKKYGINLELDPTLQNKPQAINNELEKISDQIYDYIYRKSGSNTVTLKWIVAKSIRRGMTRLQFRNELKDIMRKQANYYVNNDDLTEYSNTDIYDKRSIDSGVMLSENRHISYKVKASLESLGLAWCGSYDNMFFRFLAEKNW